MSEDSLENFPHFIRYIEKQVEWLGLAKNTGPVLALLYLRKYSGGERLSAEEIAEMTGYSRNYVSMILSQLEVLGLVYGEVDHDQTGRGRRRHLYAIDEAFTSLAALGTRRAIDRLEESLRELEYLDETYGKDVSFFGELVKKFREETEEELSRFIEPSQKSKRVNR
jgi:DNA-binding transcriptional regulator GbsR (MarR family)